VRASGRDDIPFLFCSGRGTAASRVEGLEAGADDYLVKPVPAEPSCGSGDSSCAGSWGAEPWARCSGSEARGWRWSLPNLDHVDAADAQVFTPFDTP
jgi:hypothetical protein